MLSRFYWGPTDEGSRGILEGNYLRPCEDLKLVLNCKPPGILDELKSSSTSFAGEDEIFQYLEQAYVQAIYNQSRRR